jgi:hypothetical protein
MNETENMRMLDESQRKSHVERLDQLNIGPSNLLRVIPAQIQIKVNDKLPILPFN